MNLRILFISLIFITSFLNAQVLYTQNDKEICKSKFQFAVLGNLVEKPIGEVIVEIGKTFLGLDYEAHTLEKGNSEQLVIHLTGLDCYTFFESSLVFARCVKIGSSDFDDYQEELKSTRYRDGEIDGYPSRLHYASDWLYDNDKRDIVEDVTKKIGGIPFIKKIDFMSTHPNSYKRLKNNNEFVDRIAKIEEEITNREKYYIPQEMIGKVEKNLNNGDIILITANADGLDISHTGIAVKMDNGRIHFMHAPIKGKKIQITEKPLADYIQGTKRHTGIMVARPLEPGC